jgi:hypothetical protein
MRRLPFHGPRSQHCDGSTTDERTGLVPSPVVVASPRALGSAQSFAPSGDFATLSRRSRHAHAMECTTTGRPARSDRPLTRPAGRAIGTLRTTPPSTVQRPTSDWQRGSGGRHSNQSVNNTHTALTSLFWNRFEQLAARTPHFSHPHPATAATPPCTVARCGRSPCARHSQALDLSNALSVTLLQYPRTRYRTLRQFGRRPRPLAASARAVAASVTGRDLPSNRQSFLQSPLHPLQLLAALRRCYSSMQWDWHFDSILAVSCIALRVGTAVGRGSPQCADG